MGVDAEMFVRIRGRANWLREEDLLKASYELASTLGSDNFLITIGRFPDEPKWQHHALSIIRPLQDKADAADHGLNEAHIGRTVWTQDGPTIVAENDEQFVRVHLGTRYYGEDYARGNWPIIRATTEWLEKRFPMGAVWYGGDSSGICAEHLTRERREQLNDFFLSSGRKTYERYFARPVDEVTGTPAPQCPACNVTTIHCGGGQGEAFWYCDGCGKKAVTSKSGTRWLDRHQDFFDRNNPVAAGMAS